MATITQRRKDELVTRAKEHRAADRLKQSFDYFSGYDGEAKGCAIGCLAMPLKECMKPIQHEMRKGQAILRLEAMGLPERLTLLAEEIFERLPQRDRRTWRNWPTRFAQSLPVGEMTDVEVFDFTMALGELDV